ncbi:MAG: hypothetical protein GY812_10175 [Actinomycetia bacterium]|nr:hypothetical protein [Actinomycetes bacterium]
MAGAIVGRKSRSRARTLAWLGALLGLMMLTAACLPAQPSAGRGTPVKRVLIIGDSIAHGLFGTTPKVHSRLTAALADRGVALRIDGYPGENPIDTWPSNSTGWLDRMRAQIAAFDPDMVIVQSMLFPDPDNPARRELYLGGTRALLDIAGSRGAHVYLVNHPIPPGAQEAHARAVAQSLQAQAAAGRGISTIPLDYWLGSCDRPYVSDGWHLSANGQACHTLAMVAAVDQLRGQNG